VRLKSANLLRARLAAVPSVRRALWQSALRRELAYLETLDDRLKAQSQRSVGLSSIFRNAQRDFFFVLGNGDSVNELRPEDFDFIQAHFSVGLNAWPLHSFIPSVYALEDFGNIPGREPDEFEKLFRLALEKSKSDGRDILLLRPPLESLGKVLELAGEFRAVTLVPYGRVNVPKVGCGRIDAEVRFLLRYLRSSGASQGVLLDDGASVVRMVSFALLNGFKKIVLVGVDLNAGDYFWYSPRFIASHGDFRKSVRREAGEGMDTLSASNRPFPVDVFLSSLGRVAKADFGAEILVTSRTSRLAESLGIFYF
jgi:hypothetical protein